MGLKSKYKIENYTGQSFNKWTVLSFSHVDSKGQQYWLCKCKCGIEKSVRTSHLFRNLNKGCQKCRGQASMSKHSPYWKGGNFISKTFITTYKLSAKKRNIKFNLTIKDLEKQWIKQKGKCKYTGTILILPKHSRDKSFNCSLDRIDSKKAYTVSNIQWVTKEINLMKMNIPHKRFLQLCKLVSKN